MSIPQNSRVIVSVLALLMVAGTEPARADEKVPAEIVEHASTHGKVPVLVGLNVPWQRESGLTPEEVAGQRQAIAAIQRELLTELAGRTYSLIRPYRQVPAIALEVGLDALAELARSERVTNVLLDRPVRNAQALENEKVPAQLFDRARTEGSVLVLAGLRTPWRREDQLDEELKALQRSGILSAQSYVLAELNGTQFKVMRLYRRIPGLALRVGVDALQVLQKSPAVTNVIPDRPATTLR
jgi:hypothetical protein